MSELFTFDGKPNQRAFFYDKGRVTGYWGGYGNGKTYAGCGKGWLLTEGIPGNVGLVGRKTYPSLNSSTRETFLNIARARNGGTLDPGPIIEGFNKQENILRLRNGSKVIFRTLDEVEKLRSLNLGWALVDQTEEVAYEIFLELNGRIRFWNKERVKAWQRDNAYLLDQLGYMPEPTNQLICVGNPAPNWAKNEFGPESKRPHIYYASTHENQKYLPEDYISELTKQYPKEWVSRFIEGSWETFGGQVYKEFQADTHLIQPFEIPSHWPRFVGWDHGLTNPTAAMFLTVDEEGNAILYKEYYRSGLTVEEYAKDFKELCKADYVPRGDDECLQVWMDPSTKGSYGPQEISVWEAYRKNGIWGHPANNDVEAGILWQSSLIHPDPDHTFPAWHPRAGQKGSPRFFVFRRNIKGEAACPNFVNEMALYEWVEAAPESNAPERPRKWKDHSLDAVRYGLMAIRDTKAIGIKTEEQKAREFMAQKHKEMIDAIFETAEDEG